MSQWTMKPNSRGPATNPGWQVIRPDGTVAIFDETYTVCSNIVHACNTGRGGGGECGEVARSLLSEAGQ